MYVRYAAYGVVALFLFYIGFQTGREDAQANQGCKKADPAATAQNENFIPSLRGEGGPCDETASLSQPGGGVGMRKVDTYQSFFGGSRQKDTRKTCPNYPDYGQYFLHIKQNHKEMKQVVDSVLNLAFDELHHPPSPANSEIIASLNRKITRYEECSEIYLTRSGARESMPNKCLAIVWANADKVSPWRHSHRYGVQAKMVDRYVDDYLERVNYPEETEELPLVLRGYKQSIEQFKQLLGDPINTDGSRKAVVVMVANEGVMDLVLNFLCSCREKAAGIDISSIAIFLGQPEYVPVVNSMGAHGIFNQFLSQIPKKAAGNYGDKTFGRLMWLKTTSVYIALQAGFDVIFQDADLVWLKDPVPHLHKVVRDVAFMDDGARTPRFTPYFVNSGFYYFKHNPRVLYLMERMLKGGPGEISVSHSHQSVLIRYLTEVHDMNGIKVDVLGSTDFPSGAMYHNNKTFIKRIKDYKEEPYVFHMCWTANREDKVKYLKDLGMWYLPDETNARHNTCEKPQQMIAWAKSARKGENLLSHCCMAGDYFNNKP